jgi:hypothetical protein
MSANPRATIEELGKLEGEAELVNGAIVERPPSRDDPRRASQAAEASPPAGSASWPSPAESCLRAAPGV